MKLNLFVRHMSIIGSVVLMGIGSAAHADDGHVGTEAGTELSTRQPLGNIFAPGKSRLSKSADMWLRHQVVQAAKRPDRMVIVSISGTDSALQQQRVNAIRQRLVAMGVSAEHVYFEAT